MTGIYAADFGPELELGTGKVLSTEGAHGRFEIRSACAATGCVAIAEATAGPSIQRQLIFDSVAGQWVAVGTAPSTSPAISTGLLAGCGQGLSPELWETVVLQQRPDGTLTGQYEVENANNCNTSRTVTLTRTGDANMANIADPTQLPPRVTSPAQGFRGHYRYIYSAQGLSHDNQGYVRTDCLRTGERCVSAFQAADSAEPFVYADGRWTLHYNAPVSCGSADGPRVRIDRSAELELPQPASDPIATVFGHGQEEVTGETCAIPLSNYNLRFERVGD